MNTDPTLETLALARRFARDEGGATSIEYALIGSLIAVVIISAVRGIGNNLSATFTRIGTNLGTR